MDLRKIMEIQSEFDKMHVSKFEWDKPITEENIEMLEFLLVCIMGEIGEFSNITKKIRRGDYSLEEQKKYLIEEISDVFIYTIKICNQLNINLETAFLDKLQINKEKFKHYERNSNEKYLDGHR